MPVMGGRSGWSPTTLVGDICILRLSPCRIIPTFFGQLAGRCRQPWTITVACIPPWMVQKY